ncbi:hypothetical protein BXZ70DRAFT_400100 [Cristinia sonorae]|uniref:Uncharacterized protein n=1 Tax=Cristinia sonorae TaxID=1940300 RepID=A0A8K0UW48_9AGAR|nr:hypothetical protein BXZ70DRAFT_400100 [Cristinia sonorae]
MEYTPRYPQPFTVAQAAQLDVPVITEEISRIENSLDHLKRTQVDLEEALKEDPDDTDFRKAHEENEDVIGSQKERISMLQMALAEKGIPTSSHYDSPVVSSEPPVASRVTVPETRAADAELPPASEGIDL